jgi:hypothetical protein
VPGFDGCRWRWGWGRDSDPHRHGWSRIRNLHHGDVRLLASIATTVWLGNGSERVVAGSTRVWIAGISRSTSANGELVQSIGLFKSNLGVAFVCVVWNAVVNMPN